jgi:hypothetical protein
MNPAKTTSDGQKSDHLRNFVVTYYVRSRCRVSKESLVNGALTYKIDCCRATTRTIVIVDSCDYQSVANQALN